MSLPLYSSPFKCVTEHVICLVLDSGMHPMDPSGNPMSSSSTALTSFTTSITGSPVYLQGSAPGGPPSFSRQHFSPLPWGASSSCKRIRGKGALIHPSIIRFANGALRPAPVNVTVRPP